MFGFFIAILCLPMLSGQWLAGPLSDQLSAGVPFRGWGAEWWRRLGHIPLWNPEIFAGMPYVGALGTGDILYPTAVVLRLLLPTPTAINIGFFIHYVLAGLFTYLFLRRLGVSWSGAVIAGLAYQLSGIVASYVQPGHDGKLVVTALLPLVLLGLVLGVRDRRPAGYALVALGVSFSIFTQHVQMTYYMLLTAGLFALYLALLERPRPAVERVKVLAAAFGAVALGFGIAAIQLLPAFAHMPLSPRAEGVQGGFQVATSYAIPWVHVPEFFLKWFVGWGAPGTYWGTNGLKLHSEYLGLPVIALALWGARSTFVDRRLKWWLAGTGLLFLLVGLGSGTPFYRLWYTVMPYVKQMRAPGMAFFVVAFVVSCFAGFGVERVERRADDTRALSVVRIWLIAAAVLVLLGGAGLFGNMARALSETRDGVVASRDIMLGAITSALALALVAAIVWAGIRGRLRPVASVLLLALVIGGDLWVNARPYWTYTTLDKTLYKPDAIAERIKAGPSPTRVLDVSRPMGQPVYPGNVLMAMGVPQLLGEHGLEIRYFDDVLGGHNTWRNLGNTHLWDLFAVRWVITPSRTLDSIPGFTRVLQGTATSSGAPADLFERKEPAPYAWVVTTALAIDSGPILTAMSDPRMPFDRLVLLNVNDGIQTPPVTQLPEPSPTRATIEHWEPGRMTITLEPPTAQDSSYLVVAENWYPDWHAHIQGRTRKVYRGNWTLITVVLPRFTRQVELEFRSNAYENGQLITILSTLIALGLVLSPPVARRWRARRSAPAPVSADA